MEHTVMCTEMESRERVKVSVPPNFPQMVCKFPHEGGLMSKSWAQVIIRIWYKVNFGKPGVVPAGQGRMR